MLLRPFFCLLLIACLSCSSKNEKKNFHSLAARQIKEKGFLASGIIGSPNTLIQTQDFTGVIFDRENKDLRDDNGFTPSVMEVLQAEKILLNCFKVDTVDFSHDSMYISKKRIKPLTEYRRQYRGRLNEKGQRVISINCFRYSKEDSYSEPYWLRWMISTRDGGNNYWRISINLTTKRCGYFSVNGLAFHPKASPCLLPYFPYNLFGIS
jgi:hypothetical protein